MSTTLPQASRPATFTLSEDANLARLAWRKAKKQPQHVSFETFVNDHWRGHTASQHLEAVVTAARGLLAMGVMPGDRVAIMSETRYEWLLLDSAAWAVGAATVPIYPSSSRSQVEWIVHDSQAKVVVVETETMGRQLTPGPGQQVLIIDDGALATLALRGQDVDASAVSERVEAVRLSDAASIVYTSGTTGRPKGCILTHENLAAEVKGLLSQPIGNAAGPGKRTLMFLPLAHVLARAVTYAAAEGGSTVGFWADTRTLVEKLQSFTPNLVLGVPRVFEKVHDGVRASARRGGPAKSEIFRRAEQVAINWSRARAAGDRPSLRARAEYTLFDRLVYRQVRAALGGRCDYAISGGGAMREDLAHFFNGLGVPVYEGYGLTETCAAITVNEPGATRFGSVGRPVSGNAVRIGQNGEVEVSGLVVFHEYWGNPQATEEAFHDGWFRTGDLGSLDAEGYLRITGRQKEIIVTAGGKNVVPGPMEEILRANPVVGHAMVVGEGMPFVSAIITLDDAGARAWAADNNRDPEDLEGLCDDPALRVYVQGSVDDASATVSRAEGIKRFTILPRDFSEESGELTATLKIKRHVIEKQHAKTIAAMYRHRQPPGPGSRPS